MSKEGTWGLIGYGNIGKETFRQVSLSERKVYQRLGVMVLPSLMVNQKDGIWRPAIEHVSEIQQLENEVRKVKGTSFNQREFNETLIGHGSLPVGCLRSYFQLN